MAKRLSVSVGMKFDDIQSLKLEAQGLLDKLGKQVKLNIGNVDLTNIENAVNKLNKKVGTLQNTNINLVGANDIKNIEEVAKALSKIEDISKYKVELMADGQVKIVTEVNNQLKETVKVIQNLTNGNKSISISSNVDKEKKDAYNEIIKLQKTEYDLKNKLISADGEYAKVIQEQINHAQQLQKVTKQEIDKTNLSDAKIYNEILKERSSLESKLNLQKSKVETSNTNKFNQELLKQNDYLDKAIAKLKLYQQSVKNSGNGKPTQQADLSSEITRQIGKIEELKNSNNLLGTAEKNRINSTISQMRLQTNELVKYESSFSNLFKKMSMYALGGGIIYNGISEVKKGINNIIELDTAMRDLTKVAKATQQQLDEFTSVANRMAIEVGASTEAIIEATTYYSKLGYSITEASERAKNATIFSNVGDMGIEDATKALITIQKGFNLNSLEDMTRIMDVANEVGNNYTSTAEDVAEGLRRMGNAMYEAGNSYEQSVGLFVAGNASIQDAEVVGNAIKTITMRMRGMETEIDDTSIPVSKLRDEIKQLTADAGQMVDIMIDDNTFKSTYDQMTELAKVYPKLTDGQRSYLQYVIAGQRQGNIFSGMMSNMSEGVDAYNTALNSAGSAMAEQERYIDSIEGKINKFTETLKSVWVESISSDTIKSIVDMGTSVVEIIGSMSKAFGLIPTTIGVATTAIILFNKEMYKGFTQNIPIVGKLSTKIDNFAKVTQMSMGKTISNAFNKFSQSMTTAGAKTTILTAKNGVLAVSFKAVEIASSLATGAMTLGLSFAIQAVIGGIVKLVDNIVNANDKLREFNDTATETVNSTTKSIAEAEELLSKKIALENSIANSKSAEERKNLESELLDIQKQLAGVLPQSASGFDNEGDAISASNSLIEESIRLKREEMELSALGFIEKNRNIGSEIDKLADLKKQYEDMKLLQINGGTYVEKKMVPNGNGGVSEITVEKKATASSLKKLQEQIKDITTTAQQSQVHIQSLINSGYTMEQINEMGFNTESVDNYINSLRNASNSANDAKNNSDGVFDSVAESAENATNSLKDLSNSFSSLQSDIDLLNKMKEEYSNYGILDTSTLEKVLSSGNSELIALLGDEANLIDNINGLLDKKAESQSNAYKEAVDMAISEVNASNQVVDTVNQEIESYDNLSEAKANASNNSANERINSEGQVLDQNSKHYSLDVQNHNDAENNKIKGSFASANERMRAEADATTNNGNNYSIDSRNHANSENSKIKNSDGFANASVQGVASMVTNNDKNYRLDSSNFASATNSKLANIRALNDAVGASAGLLNEYKQLTAETEETSKVQQSILYGNNGANLKKPSIGSVNSSYVGSGGLSNLVGHGSTSGSSGSSSGGSSSTAKEVADLEDLRDRYVDLNDAINDYTNALELNKLMQNNATGTKKIELMREELKLYENLQKASKALLEEQKREANSIKDNLYNQGVRFDGSGDISNYNSILESKRNWANSLSGDAKEQAKEQVKALEESMKSYIELVNNKIPEQEREWQSLANTIKDVQKDMTKAVADQEKQIYDTISYYAEKATKKKQDEIDKQIKALQKSYEDEDKEDELNKKRQELTELRNEMAKYENAVDARGKARYEQLLAEYEKQQEELNQIIRDNQKESMIAGMEEEKEQLDKDLEDLLSPANINKLIADALSSGMVEIGGEVVDLQQAMSQMLKETTIGTQNLINTNDELISSLREALSIYQSISSINSSLGLQNIKGLDENSRSSATTFSGDIVVNVPKLADGVSADDVGKAIKSALKEYDKQFK